MNKTHYFKIAEHNICIKFAENLSDTIELLPSFAPFSVEDCEDEDLLFNLEVTDRLELGLNRELIRECVTGNGYTVVYKLDDGGYQYIIQDINHGDCCYLETNESFSRCICQLEGEESAKRSFGLNNALMLIYAFAGSCYDTLLVHASCPMTGGRAYPFIAKSGTGKSTHSSLWIKNIPNTELLNDDNPVIRVIDGKPYVFGSPWSGKTPCYRNMYAPLGAVTRISRADRNYVERLKPVQAFASLLPSCSSMKWDKEVYAHICDTITKLIETTPMFTMHCLPNDEAAIVCHKEIAI